MLFRSRDVADALAVCAQARLTARIVLGLPILTAAGMLIVAPSTAAALVQQPLSLMLMTAAAVLQVLALLAVRVISRPAAGLR